MDTDLLKSVKPSGINALLWTHTSNRRRPPSAVPHYGQGPPPIGETIRPCLTMDTDLPQSVKPSDGLASLWTQAPPQSLKQSDGCALLWTRTRPIGEALRRPSHYGHGPSPIGEGLRRPCLIMDTDPAQPVKLSDGHALLWARTPPQPRIERMRPQELY